jgi:hypothetical protein
MHQLGPISLAAYLAYVVFLESMLLAGSCTNCYYHGKLCAFGKGRLSAIFFKRGNADRFAQRQITWRDIIPDFLVSMIPIVVGIVLLVRQYDVSVLSAVILLAFLTSCGNGFVRGSLACNHCRQREIGCPAERLFKKSEK